MSILDKFYEKTVAVVIGDELRHIPYALIEAGIVASSEVIRDTLIHQLRD